MHPTTESTLARVDRLLRDWVAPAVHRSRHQLSAESWPVPGEPVPFASARSAQYRPHPVGEPWGRAWSTVWFHVTGRVPAHWPEPGTRLELVVDLGFNEQMPGFQAEGAAWSPDGRLLKGISPRNAWLPLPQVGGSEVDLYLEAAANPDAYLGSWTTPTAMGDPATVPDRDLYRLRALDVALVDLEVEKLAADLKALRGLAEVLPAVSPRRAQLVEALAEACDALDPGDVAGSAGSARAALAPALAAPASASAHRIHAVGHAHIDSAWLWPTSGDRPQGRPHGRERAGPDGHGRGRRLRLLLRPALRLAAGVGARAVRAARRAGAGGPHRAGRRDVGGVRHQPGRRRGAGAPVRRGHALLPRAASAIGTDRRLAAGLVRVHGRSAADRPARRLQRPVRPEDVLERHQPVPAPHLLVGGPGRVPVVHPLPARWTPTTRDWSRPSSHRASRKFADKGRSEHLARRVRLR